MKDILESPIPNNQYYYYEIKLIKFKFNFIQRIIFNNKKY